MSTRKILLIRHAEKPDASLGLQGVDERGNANPHGLSVRGWQRAGALVRFFAPLDGHVRDRRIDTPATIFAAATSAAHPSPRPLWTVEPLARALRVEVRQDLTAEARPDQLVAAVEAADGPVLLSWRHASMAAFAAALTEGGDVPAAWPEDRYDMVWVFQRDQDRWSFAQVPQLLLPRDSPEPIR
ncbi:hypothetical protein [Caldimonas brevitalea]|uniref:Histidine phosphatase family protein n=1 Tax=Caldimonas brevitalea TaxID=413882 RepID=A0A0G3BVZ5_9BURK|nr:hypothetical protein [Caldimonas brevitalea]AKJ31546.1 hypothetical protein AAW51_4855 [Caldimonas brevitalea]